MNEKLVAALRGQLGGPRDGALLRYSLGQALLAERPEEAAQQLREAVHRDADYSAAWKLLGKACQAVGDDAGAAAAWRAGIAAAGRRGDQQAGKEMAVFLRRLAPPAGPP